MINTASFLTPAQQRITHVLADAEQEARPYFVSEVVSKLNYAGESSLTPTLKILERKGLVVILGGGPHRNHRLVKLTSMGKRIMGIGGLPILGAIPAGPLAESIQNADEYIEVGEFLSTKPDDFLLRVKGDSMVEAGILDGDLALIRPNLEVKQGKIAAVYTGDEYSSTLKKVFFEKNHVRLKPCNSTYQDIMVPFPNWRGVVGVFKGLVRNT